MRAPAGLFRPIMLVISIAVAALVFLPLARLGYWSVTKYGTDLPQFWIDSFADPAFRRIVSYTAIVVFSSCALATLVGGALAWLNERTDAAVGPIGRVLPLVPFLMPAIALPLGWIFLAAPNAGIINVALRGVLGWFGQDSDTGPLNIFSLWGLIFLYTVFMIGFAYLVIAGAMQNLDSGLEEAAKVAGAKPLTILVKIVLPAIRPALVSSFLLCLIPGVAMVSVPVTIGPSADITVLSVHVMRMVTREYPAPYEEAFLYGLLLLVPILLAWLFQRYTAGTGRFSVIGGKASRGPRVKLGRRGRLVGRLLFVSYIFIAVVLPLGGLVYVSGLDFWSASWPESWSLVSNVREALADERNQQAILWSVLLGLAGGVALMLAAHILSYGQRLFPRFGPIVDALAKSPAGIANILIAIAFLVTLGGPPFELGGTAWLLLICYFVVYLPFASVVANGAQQMIGKDMIEAAKVAGASPSRALWSVVTPLSRTGLVAGFLLMFVLVSGDLNVSAILASSPRPVVGWVMLELYEFSSLPRVATFALVTTAGYVVIVGILLKLLSANRRQRVR